MEENKKYRQDAEKKFLAIFSFWRERYSIDRSSNDEFEFHSGLNDAIQDILFSQIPEYREFDNFIYFLYKNNPFNNNLSFEVHVLLTSAQIFWELNSINKEKNSDLLKQIHQIFNNNSDYSYKLIKFIRNKLNIAFDEFPIFPIRGRNESIIQIELSF
ncbi:MAG TPA: hypothetical protein DCY95_12500, partial [Algoriphagus sp.]|nr:hypothetical protein [Algoriphagus sp.]